MIRLKHILAEIGEANATPYPYRMYREEAYFETAGGTMYQVSFPHGSDDVMEIAFATRNRHGEWDHDVETAEGDVYRVMSTIVDIARKAVELRRPKMVVFGVAKSDPRRMRLYKAYVLRVLRGYSVSQENASFVELERDEASSTRYDWTGIKDK